VLLIQIALLSALGRAGGCCRAAAGQLDELHAAGACRHPHRVFPAAHLWCLHHQQRQAGARTSTGVAGTLSGTYLMREADCHARAGCAVGCCRIMGHAGCTSGYAAGYYKAVSSQGMNTCLRLVVNPGCSTDVPGCSTDVPSLATPLMCHPWLL